MTDPLNRALVSARAISSERSGITFYARSLAAEIGVPMSFDIQESKLTAVEHLLGALAADLLGGFRRLASQRRIVVDGLEAFLKAEVAETLTYLGVVGETGTPRISSIVVNVYAESGTPETEVRALWLKALTLAPIANTLRLSTPLDIAFTVTA